jgi:gliding motility-associated lipoprotein GldH
MKRYTIKWSGLLLTALWLLWGCDPDRFFEENHDIPLHLWGINRIEDFSFTIADTTQEYTVYYNVRNALSYPYYNLYLTYYLKDEQGRQLRSQLQELMLMDSQTGKPNGSGLGDIFDHQILAIDKLRFPHAGKYTFSIQHYMRQDPLPDIMSIGIRIEKYQPAN